MKVWIYKEGKKVVLSIAQEVAMLAANTASTAAATASSAN